MYNVVFVCAHQCVCVCVCVCHGAIEYIGVHCELFVFILNTIDA